MRTHETRPKTQKKLAPWLSATVLLRLDWRTVAAFALPFLLYLLTLAPTIYNLDSAELTTAAATGGLVRATGYPLYLLIGRVWSLLPIGDVGYRMNLFSAACGALTVALVERILRRWRIGPWATFGALGLLTVSTFFWALSLIAEVYTLHTVLMTTVILLLLRWSDKPTAGQLATVGLVMGLSFGHHAATVLLVPGCVWYVATVAPRRAFALRSLGLSAAAFLLGISVYLYLPFVHATSPLFNYAGIYDASGTFQPINLQTPDGLWWLISGRAFSSLMLGYSGGELWTETKNYGIHLWRAFFAVGIGPGLLGLLLLWRRNWRLAGMLMAMFACSAAFYIDYRVIDKDTMFLPTYVIWALWLGLGLQWLLDWVAESHEKSGPMWEIYSLRAGIVIAVLFALLLNWSQVELSHDTSTRLRGERILKQVEPDALVFGWWETVPVVEYLQLVEGQRPDVNAINRFMISYENMETLIKGEISQRPIYMDAAPQELLSTLKLRATKEKEGVLYRLEPRLPLSGIKSEWFHGR